MKIFSPKGRETVAAKEDKMRRNEGITIIPIRDFITTAEEKLKNSRVTIFLGTKDGIKVVSIYTFYAPKIKEWRQREKSLCLTDARERERILAEIKKVMASVPYEPP